MKKIKSTTGETIKFRPDVKILAITPEGIVTDEVTATLIESRLGGQVTIEDTDEIITPEGEEVAAGAEVKADVDAGDMQEEDVKTE